MSHKLIIYQRVVIDELHHRSVTSVVLVSLQASVYIKYENNYQFLQHVQEIRNCSERLKDSIDVIKAQM